MSGLTTVLEVGSVLASLALFLCVIPVGTLVHELAHWTALQYWENDLELVMFPHGFGPKALLFANLGQVEGSISAETPRWAVRLFFLAPVVTFGPLFWLGHTYGPVGDLALRPSPQLLFWLVVGIAAIPSVWDLRCALFPDGPTAPAEDDETGAADAV